MCQILHNNKYINPNCLHYPPTHMDAIWVEASATYGSQTLTKHHHKLVGNFVQYFTWFLGVAFWKSLHLKLTLSFTPTLVLGQWNMTKKLIRFSCRFHIIFFRNGHKSSNPRPSLKPCGTVVLLFALWKKQAKTVELVFICLPLCLGRVFKSYFPSHQFCWNHCFNAKFV